MKQICELNDKIILGLHGRSSKVPRLTAHAIVQNQDGLMYKGSAEHTVLSAVEVPATARQAYLNED